MASWTASTAGASVTDFLNAVMIKLASRWAAANRPAGLTTNTVMISASAIGSFSHCRRRNVRPANFRSCRQETADDRAERTGRPPSTAWRQIRRSARRPSCWAPETTGAISMPAMEPIAAAAPARAIHPAGVDADSRGRHSGNDRGGAHRQADPRELKEEYSRSAAAP